MPKISQSNFSKGMITPSSYGEYQKPWFRASCRLLQNGLILTTGAVMKRPAFEYLFNFTETYVQAYAYGFGGTHDYVVAVSNTHLYVLDIFGTNPGVVATFLIATQQAGKVSFASYGRGLLFTSLGQIPQMLERSRAGVFSVRTLSFGPPTTVGKVTGVTVTVDTAGASGDRNVLRSYVVTAVDDEGLESVPSQAVSITAKATAVLSVTYSADTGAETYRIYKEINNGSEVYGYIGESLTTSFLDDRISPDESRTAPLYYDPITNRKPRIVSFIGQRAVYANAVENKHLVMLSRTGTYSVFSRRQPTVATDSIVLTVNAPDSLKVTQFAELNGTLMFTDTGCYAVEGDIDGTIAPSTISFNKLAGIGSSDSVPPVVIGSALAVVSYDRYNLKLVKRGQFDMPGASSVEYLDILHDVRDVFSEHRIKNMTFMADPVPVLWLVLENGDLYSFTLDSEDSIIGMSRHTSTGATPGHDDFVEIVTASDGTSFHTLAFVRRPGFSGMCVERLTHTFVDTALNGLGRYLDSSVEVASSTDTRSFTSPKLSRYVGKPAHVVTDKGDHFPASITGDTLTLPATATPAKQVLVGFPYYFRLRTHGLEVLAETELGRKLQLTHVVGMFYDTYGRLQDDSVGDSAKVSLVVPQGVTAKSASTSFAGEDLVTLGGCDVDTPWKNADATIELVSSYPFKVVLLELLLDVNVGTKRELSE